MCDKIQVGKTGKFQKDTISIDWKENIFFRNFEAENIFNSLETSLKYYKDSTMKIEQNENKFCQIV